MGVQEFDAMFDVIDLTRKGHITIQQLHEFCEDIYQSRICIQHVEGAVKLICGPTGTISRRYFLDVLTDVERRKTTEEHAYWDFQALDFQASNRITLRDALLLFRQIHGDQFSLSTWKRFLASRESPGSDVYFDEVRFWLCAPPSGSPCSDKEFKEEENKMVMKQAEFSSSEYHNMKMAIDDDYSIQKEREEHEEETTGHARRKLRKWNQQGVEAMLFDDGLDVEEGQLRVAMNKSHVTMADLNELLEIKYEKMREKLMRSMADQASAVADEIPEMLQQIRRQWKQLCKAGENYTGNIPGGDGQMPSSLTGLMGELRIHDREHRRQIEALKAKMRNEGRTPQEISLAVQGRYKQIIGGDNTCAGLLLQVNKRHLQEREVMMQVLKLDPQLDLKQAMAAEYCRLMKQLLVLEEEKDFLTMTTAVGLSERAMDPRPDRSDWDRSRSERLAQLRLQDSVGRKQARSSPGDVPDLKALESAKMMDLQTGVVREMAKKHFYEREALIHMLLSKEAKSGLEQARKMKSDQRKHELKVLQNQHSNWKTNPRADLTILHQIFMQAVWLKMEERRVEVETNMGTSLSVEEVREVLIADLQQRQGTDFEAVIQNMQMMKKTEVMVILKKECRSRVEELFDNIASILLDSLQITAEDEEYIQALDNKYDSLRKRVFLLTLKDKLDWKNFSKEEKQHALREIMRQEKLLRSEGRLSEMDQLVGMRVKMLPPLRSLIGEDKAEYQRRLGQNKPDEDPTDPNKVTNILADLVPRYDNDQDFLLSWLHSHEAKGLSLRMKRMRIVEIKVETCRIDMEEDCEIAAVSTGLMERVKETLSRRHPSDEERQAQLARKRVQLRGQRLRENIEYRKEPEISKDKLPKKGDITGRQVVYLHEMLKRHRDERELTLGYLQDESIDDLIEVASTMSDNDRQQRLTELQGKRINLNLTFQDDQEEHSSILEEAAALRAVGVKQQLVAAGNTATMEAIAVVILAELQEEQDKELALTLLHLEDMNEEDIDTGLHREISNRSLGTAWNVINVLTRYQGEATDDALLKALEAKYLELRKMLLADSLRVRLGSDKWDSLSPGEKEQKLSNVEAQYQEQAQLGRIMPSLLGETFVLHETVPHLMGVCPHVFNNKVKGQIITGHHANLHMEEDQGAVSKRGEPENPLKQLISRFEEEKLALVRQLKGQSEHFFGESDRQVQLACYQRECILAGQQQNFVTTATRVGLMERQQEEVKFRLMKDKERYERLAKSVVADIEKGRQQELPLDTTMVGLSNEMDMTLRMLENKHLQEKELFQRLLSSGHKYEDLRQEAAVCSGQQLLNKLTGLRDARIKSVLDRQCENLEVLTEATVYKVEGRRNQVTMVTGNVSEEQLHISLMADLLEQQNSDAMRVIKKLSGANEQEFKQYQGKIRQDQKFNMADNIAAVVLSPDLSDGTSETDILDALKGKYDALKDKLLAEALMKELGESNWNRMSEKERQRRIFQLKLKEKQLRREGKIDEANALIAGLLKEQEHLRKLMGDSAQNQRERLQERIRRRKERLAQGMSKEEVDRLEKEEIEQEEEEERNKHRNILEDLDNRFEQERDEILRRLQEAGDDFEKERERQANLARLHRDERLARMEDNFGSAALILGLSEKRDKDLRLRKEEERERQERLARERLEAARQRRGKGGKSSDDEDDAMQQVDTEDTVSLQEAIAHYMDRKQRREMDLFIQLLEENVNGKHRKSARGMSSEERDDKMFELRELHKNWTMSDDKDPQVELELLKEMIGYLSEIVKGQLEADGKSAGNDDVQVALLADLQEQHKKESQRLLNDIETKDLEALQELHKALSVLNKDSHHDNITAVLLGHQTGERLETEEDEEEELDEGETSKREVVKVLEQKYDAIKDKLLIEALMKEHGEKEWAMMSEKDRQRKLIELKLKERKLRREGKQDEIANIIGSHLQDEKLLDELLTESKKSQRQRLEERLARRKQLISEREEAGLATDDNTIEEILDEEEKQEEIEKRRNILENLQQNFDAERDALLRSLSHQKDKVMRERERQIALAKLKRQERQMKKGEKLDSIAMIISSSREDDKRREHHIAAEKDRQRKIALERIEARRRKKNKPGETEADMEQKLAEDEEKMKLEDALLDVEGHNIHETVIVAVETKQEEELNMLMSMLEQAKSDRSVESKHDADLKSELAQMEQEHGRWKRNSTQVFMAMDRTHLTEEDSQKHMGVVAKQRKELQKLLTGALAHRLEVDRRSLRQKEPNLSADQIEQELQVALVTDLQMKHTSEGRAIQHMLEEEDDATLREVRKSQQMAAREGWYQNLVNTIFHVPSLGVGAGPVEEIEETFHNTLTQMEEEFEQEKQEVIRKAREQAGEGEEIDEEAVTREILQQYENKKQKLLDQMNSQREAMLKKLETRRMSQDQKDYEELASRAILKMAKDQMVSSEKSLEQERDKQSTLLQQRLSERREARKMARDVKESMERENTLDAFDQDRSKSSSSKRSTVDSATPPFGMQREKTVVDVNVSEEQKQAQLNRMIQQQKELQSKISEQQRKQEEMLKRRIEARKGKQKSEAAELLSLGQRQKTILESAQQDEKQRQLQKMKERVSGMKEKREPSPSKHKRGEH